MDDSTAGYSISKTMTVLAWESNLEAIPNLMESSSEMSSGYKEQCKKVKKMISIYLIFQPMILEQMLHRNAHLPAIEKIL